MRREEEIRKMMEEKGPYFQLALPKQEDSEVGRLNETVQVLGEGIDELTQGVCVCVFWRNAARRKGRHPRKTNTVEMVEGRVAVGGSWFPH